MSSSTPQTYKTRNWPAYDEALKRRGSLMIWFDPEMTWVATPTGRRGRLQTYSDAAIQTCLSMKVLFGMALHLGDQRLGRQADGHDVFRCMGLGDCPRAMAAGIFRAAGLAFS